MSSNNFAVATDAADLLGYIRSKGVRLWIEKGELRYRARKGALLPEDIEKLSKVGGEIITLLQVNADEDAAGPALEPRQTGDRIPLTFSQLKYWHANQLDRHPSMRMLTCATRIHGPMDLSAMRAALDHMSERHESLRTRIVTVEGVAEQTISSSHGCDLAIDDLTHLPESKRAAAVQGLIDQLILEPVDLSKGPLFGVTVAKTRENEHALIIVMDHLVSDAYSLNVLLRDLLATYLHLLSRTEISLPSIPVQFADYAVWQKKAHRVWTTKHGSYWDARLQRAKRLTLPGRSMSLDRRLAVETVSVRIGKELKGRLREWCKLKKTTLVMCVFTVYVALVLRWYEAAEAVIRYQTDGRFTPKVEHTIGYFASALNLPIELSSQGSFMDLLDRVTKEYYTAYEHADLSYFDAQLPRPDFTRNPTFNWVSQEPKSGLAQVAERQELIACAPIPFTYPAFETVDRDYEPALLLYDTDEEITGAVYFPVNRFALSDMQQFQRSFMELLERLLSQPDHPVMSIAVR